ncbi:MAG: acyltransferase [Anaerolineales bacterium]|nr:acyltransferase [Chloroflexota bacterium]MBL6983521.1 acyltransferase [Anaerolineales bacterium]
MDEKHRNRKENRIHFFDNLRTAIIALVILFHAGAVYESSGITASFWIVDDPTTNNISGILNLIFDTFMMPSMFFVAGYFASLSLSKNHGFAYLKNKFQRLMVPWLISITILMPIYKFIFLASRGLTQEHWTQYFHFSNGLISQSWLWFLPILFAFHLLFVVISKLNLRLPRLSFWGAIWASFMIGVVYSFSLDIFNLDGWTKTIFLDFQNERLLTYFLVFLIGAKSDRLKVFERKPANKKLYVFANATAWIPLNLYIYFLIYPLIRPGRFIFSGIIDKLFYWFSFYLSLLCMMYVMIETFRLYLNKSGKLWQELNRNSYYVYIIHVAILGGIAYLMLNAQIPSLLKYLILALSTFVGSNLFLSISRQAAISLQGKSRKTKVIHGEI